ncbi:MAG: hypothetical protein M3P46_04835, partial [Actinomycetota bacterium]|nr:hypothetical protein [Actinomycetota bacterium]
DAEAALPTSYTSVTGREAEGDEAPAPRTDAGAGGGGGGGGGGGDSVGGTLATDEALQALREKLSGGA